MSNGTTSLHRPDEGRWLAGVAAGLGLRFGVPVWIIRVAFALLCFAGGLGALLYVAGWLLIPREGETDAIVQGWLGSGQARRWVGVTLVGLAVIILASETGLIRGDLAFAVVLIGIGVMLYRGDLSRRDRQQDSAPSAAQAVAASSAQAGPSGAEGEPPAGTPSAPPVRTSPPARETSFLGRVSVGFAVLTLGVLGLFDTVIPGFHPAFHHYVALVVGVIGLGLVVGAWFGRPGGLVAVGFVLVPILVLSRLAAGADFTSIEFTAVGQTHHRPGSIEDMRESYRLGMGELVIDLRDVDFAGRTVQLEAQVGMGELLVRIPEGVAADVNAQVGMGALQVGDRERGGIGVEGDLSLDGLAGTLVLDADVGMGQVVVNSWPVEDRSVSWIQDDGALRDTYRIRDGANLQDDYTLADGSLHLDLGELVLEDDRRVRIDVDRGEVWVTVPRDLGLRITSRVDRGRITSFDEVWEGSNLRARHSTRISGAPRLTLDIRLGDGSVIVEEER